MKRIIFDSVEMGNNGHGTIKAVLTVNSLYIAKNDLKLDWSFTGFSVNFEGKKSYHFSLLSGFSFTKKSGNTLYEKKGIFCNWLKYKFVYDNENETFSKIYV